MYLIAKRAIFTVLISIAAILWFKPDLYEFIHSPALARALIGSFFGAIGLIFLVYSFKVGTFINYGYYSLASGIIGAIYILVTEPVHAIKYIPGFLLIFTGYTIFLSTDKDMGFFKKSSSKQHLYYTAMLVCFTVMTLLFNENLRNNIEPLLLASVQEIMVLVVSWVIYLIYRNITINETKSKVNNWHILLMAVVIFLAVLTGSAGISMTNYFIAWVLGFLCPVLTVLSGVFLFKEKMTYKTAVSMIMIIIGTYFL